METSFVKTGFTLVEIVLVIAILSIIGVSSFSVGSSFYIRNNFENKSNEVISSLRTAQINALSGKLGTRWGVRITTSQIILFSGDTYESRNPVYDQIFEIPATITVSTGEVVFNRLNGNSSAPWTISIASSLGDSKNISVNEVGNVDVN